MDENFAKLVRGEISLQTYENGGVPKDFEVGARVQAKHAVGHNAVYDAIGTIRSISEWNDEALVEFDEPVEGHDGNMHEVVIQSRRGWYVQKQNLKIL